MNGPRVLRVVGIVVALLLGLALDGSASARSLRVGPLVEHWDGTSWAHVAVPSGGTGLNTVVAPAATDVWAFGSSGVAVHWDGTSWHRVSLPIPQGSAAPDILGAAAVSPDDIWAVGDVSPTKGPTHALIEHWNGSRWQYVPAAEERILSLRSRCALREETSGRSAKPASPRRRAAGSVRSRFTGTAKRGSGCRARIRRRA
jgi:hypothetical protein